MKKLVLGAAAVALVAGCNNGGGNGTAPRVLKCAEARVVENATDLVPGPLARGTRGDLVIENDKLRIIVQKGGRNWYNISEFGGNIIDGVPKAANGALIGRDNFEEFVLGTNIESAPNYQTVEVVSAGGENPDGSCKAAVIRAKGPDDLLDFINGSSAIRSLTLSGVPLNFPASADDQDLDVQIETDYTLEAGKPYLRIDTKLTDDPATTPAAAQAIYLVEYLNGSGEVEVFQHGYGFGEAYATAPCDRCNFVAYAGHEGGTGVSYGLIHDQAGSSSVSTSGVTALLYGRDIVTVALTPEDVQPANLVTRPNYTIPAGGTLTFTRWFAVGDGTVSSIVDARNEILGLSTGTIAGKVLEAGSNAPVAGAEIVMTSTARDGFPPEHGPVFNVVDHFRTASDGTFQGTYPAGTYTLEVNAPGRLAATPATASITVANGGTVTQNFTVPKASYVRVTVKDATGAALPAKVQLVGAAQGPDGAEPRNRDCFGPPIDELCTDSQNPLGVGTGFFGDPKADPMPTGISLAEFAVLDHGSGAVTVGDTGVLPVEPGTYELWVSHGPRYDAVHQPITVVEGQVATAAMTLHEVVPTPGYVHGDFHVHSLNSPDVEVTNRERMATYIAEGMDFFAPSDHDMRVDFAPVIADMGIGSLIATAPGAEVTTFDYGHYNFWPVRVEADSPCNDFEALLEELGLPQECGGHSGSRKIGGGSVDWGGQAPLGKDFPSAGNYSRTPKQIFEDAADEPYQEGREVVRQINHISWHFGTDSGGLAIDTGVNPPQSSIEGGARRLDPSITNYYDDHYDTLELIVGTDSLAGLDEDFYEENLGDWFNLLNQGRFRTAMSNSDTHQRRVTGLDARNQIAVPPSLLTATRPNIAALNADPHTLGDVVTTGFSTMTNAPFLVLEATGSGGTAGSAWSASGLGRSGNPLKAAGGAVSLKVKVQSPTWAPYDQILVFVNGETVKHTDELGQPTSPVRYSICGPESPGQIIALAPGDRPQVTAASGGKRYETTKTVPITKTTDYWIVVMVRGTQDGGSPTMFPVFPNNPVYTAGNDDGIRAFAMSNPIYIDANGDGTWTPPGVANTVHTGALLPPDGCATDLPPR